MGPPADDTGCPILHVDMDAFYASVELRRRPELRGRPVIVGGGQRGVVLSATYEAREFGVRSAMPMRRAIGLCPEAVVLPPSMGTYAEVSAGVMAVFRSVTPLVEPLSLDEAFLDVSGARRRLGRPGWIGEWIRARIADEQGITCSVGVAPTKFLAKLASSRCKPDGLLVVPADGVLAFLHPLPVGALWGVGERTAEHLAGLGLRTVGDIAALPLPALVRALGEGTATHLHALATGHDPRTVVTDEPDRSIGAEETFGTDVTDHGVVHRELLRLAEKTAARLRASGQLGRTVSIKVRFADFTTITRARTLPTPTDAGREVYGTARALYDALELDRARIRLVGVRVEGIAPTGDAALQLELGAREFGWRDADRAVDRAADRFGSGAVRPATLVGGVTPTIGEKRRDTPGEKQESGRVAGPEGQR
ncbi:MAG TPA: DNA polymerase IV [Mycobacteriales bacterium]|nr:DNA polymerase IV [Mycobacteriales bacterium]